MTYLVTATSLVQEKGVSNKLEKIYVDLNVFNSFTIAGICNLLGGNSPCKEPLQKTAGGGFFFTALGAAC